MIRALQNVAISYNKVISPNNHKEKVHSMYDMNEQTYVPLENELGASTSIIISYLQRRVIGR